jgi:hypothetical protein
VGEHPVKVPAELVKEWMAEFYGTPTFIGEVTTGLANKAAQWGADQELEACCEWLLQERIFSTDSDYLFQLRTARRPKPPSLAEQGIEALQLGKFPSTKPIKDLRAALNRLAELEANQ